MMKILLITFLLCLLFISSYTYCQTNNNKIDSVIMNLNAFGVESDNFPSIHVYINFINDSSFCQKSFYNPAIKGAIYRLNKAEIYKVFKLIKNSKIEKLKHEYKVNETDQPSSINVIFTNKRKFVINDYGLKGGYPLQELYRIVYKF